MTETSAAAGGKKFTVWHDGKKEELDGVLDYLIRRDGPDREHWSLTPPPPSAQVEAWFDGTKLLPPEAPAPEAPAPVAKPAITKHLISRLDWETIQRGREAELWSLEEPAGYAAQEEAKVKAREPKAASPSTTTAPHAAKPAEVSHPAAPAGPAKRG
jgi:hypothetical protein